MCPTPRSQNLPLITNYLISQALNFWDNAILTHSTHIYGTLDPCFLPIQIPSCLEGFGNEFYEKVGSEALSCYNTRWVPPLFIDYPIPLTPRRLPFNNFMFLLGCFHPRWYRMSTILVSSLYLFRIKIFYLLFQRSFYVDAVNW